MELLRCFKAYDIRGKVPEDLNTELAYKIGRAFAIELSAKNVVVGRDIRLESESLSDALKQGLSDTGVEVVDLGLCGTEEVYFATFDRRADGGIMITASHNPKGYNGMKLVAKDSKPISGETGLNDIQQRVLAGNLGKIDHSGNINAVYDKNRFIDHLISYVDETALVPLKIVFDAGNGAAGPTAQKLIERLPFDSIFINETPDGNFPNGVPNPLLPENRSATSKAVREYNADFGVAWDGDFDRCFLFDEKGDFIEGYYLVGLIAESLLEKHPGEKIIHDPRLTWNTIDQVVAAGGIPIQSKTGHAFIKQRMRQEDAVYGGEMSAHHYFRDFAYCDSGMIPWLLIAQLISKTGKPLSELVDERMKTYPCSGEINYKVNDVSLVIDKVLRHFCGEKPEIDRTDGISLEFDKWRMNLRASNTEPLLRLNVESVGNEELVWSKIKEIESVINAI